MTRSKGKARAKASKRVKNKQKNDYFVRKKHLIESIKKYDDFVLYEESKEVPHGHDVKSTFKKMRQVLNATKNGIGLASNQIGITKRLVIIKNDSSSDDITYMINPVIESTSGKKKYGREMCLSYPETLAVVERFISVEVSYYDENWKKHTIEYKEGNILGIVVQHELEHLSKGHCQVWDWWKDPEGKKKELEEKFKAAEEQTDGQNQTGGYDIEESDDLKKEKEELGLEDVDLLPMQEKMVEAMTAEEIVEDVEALAEAIESGEELIAKEVEIKEEK